MSLLFITHHDSYKFAFKTFHFTMWLLSFLVMERCVDVHKLTVLRIFVLIDDGNLILGFCVVFFLILGIRNLRLSNLTTRLI